MGFASSLLYFWALSTVLQLVAMALNLMQLFRSMTDANFHWRTIS